MADTQNGIANNEEEIGTDNEEESVQIEPIENQTNLETQEAVYPDTGLTKAEEKFLERSDLHLRARKNRERYLFLKKGEGLSYKHVE